MKSNPVSSLVVTTPWNVYSPRKTMPDKKYAMSLNTYRNIDYRVNNELKKNFTVGMKDQLEGVILKTPVEVTVQIYRPSKRRLDKSNIYGMSSKYLYDAMSEYGCWEDDNDEFLKTEIILPTKYEKNNGRVVWTFSSVSE